MSGLDLTSWCQVALLLYGFNDVGLWVLACCADRGKPAGARIAPDLGSCLLSHLEHLFLSPYTRHESNLPKRIDAAIRSLYTG